MIHSDDLVQDPAPGCGRLFFRGDTVTFSLALRRPMKGSAWIRTNIGRAAVTRAEIIRTVDAQETPLGRDWFDTPMRRVDAQRYQVRLALGEVGHFEAKCYFLKKGDTAPVWPPGANTAVNVLSAESCCANIVYNAFVRQFGPNKSGEQPLPEPGEEFIRQLDSARYTVIPPSGTFRDLIAELDFILGGLGCRVLMLLPVHPTPTTYARMGRFGSPYAALSFRDIDPALAVFDPKATPMEQFVELVDAVHQRHARIFLDIAINHTGWAAYLHNNHPEWLARTPEGQIEVPGAWGVQWEDLTKLDYRHKGLWRYMAEVFVTWCRRGVDGFRCDAGYMIPHAAWKYIVARVREQFPDTTFLLEGLGGKIEVTRALLDTANLDWAYSELFQNYDRSQIERYLPEAIEISGTQGLAVHFAETHDNQRLAANSPVYARMRTALCALASHQGAFGFANGVEWLATEKIVVHEAHSLNWGAPVNQVAEIGRLTRLLKRHPAFHDCAEVRLIEQGDGNQIVILRHHPPTGKRLLVLVNLDPERPVAAVWDAQAAGTRERACTDLLTGAPVALAESGGRFTCALAPGQVLCLSPEPGDLELLERAGQEPFEVPPRVERQRLRATALGVFTHYQGVRDLGDFDLEQAADRLFEDPVAFCAAMIPAGRERRVVTWQWPRDLRREVMLPPGHFLLVRGDESFRVRLVDGERIVAAADSQRAADGSRFCLLAPQPAPRKAAELRLHLSVFTGNGARHEQAGLLLLPRAEEARVTRVYGRADLLERPMLFLDTNGSGAMLRAAVAWGTLTSRYDALIAANPDPDQPNDRWVMFSACRAWLVYQGYSADINLDCLQAFVLAGRGGAVWRYKVPSGQGEHVLLEVGLAMVPGKNALRLVFSRDPAGEDPARLADSRPVRLILRPDIESRSFHHTTKAFAGPEQHYRSSVATTPAGFVFQPDEHHRLALEISDGAFVQDPEWRYMVFRSMEAERGLDPDSDLFSPGYFEALLEGGRSVVLAAEAAAGPPPAPAPADTGVADDPPPERSAVAPIEVLLPALDHYLVRRGALKTVIAGYPWFLDWGRDSLIFVRGLIAARRFKDAGAVLKLFGQYEEQGTLPNMIRGSDARDRDTSDAPLWFATACADLAAAQGEDSFFESDCGGRPVRQVLASIVHAYNSGTPNGIRMDHESGLVFSPSHFTWMDTNFPAGSPRQGYPVEIQVLWHAALRLMARLDRKDAKKWNTLADRTRESLITLFWRPEAGCLSDCLHAVPGQPARAAAADDAVRPNQLLAITLGAVDSYEHTGRILAACEELLVPGAIRSLADRPVTRPLAIVHQDRPLNDPHRPYWGSYTGDEDTRRKPAYHNGTAWTWPFPAYCEAWAAVYGEHGRETALAWLASSTRLLETGCLGHLPEILDGDAPHTARGCDAQAWGASEWVRVWLKLNENQ